MRRSIASILAVTGAFALSLGTIAGCEVEDEPDTMEEVGDEYEEMTDEAGERTEDIGDEIEEETDEMD